MAKLGDFIPPAGPIKFTIDGGKTWHEALSVSFETASGAAPEVVIEPLVPPKDEPLSMYDLGSLIASICGISDLGHPANITAACHGFLYQDDDAHDTCTLTACLNPLHPGPCKGWKGTLHEVAPKAWKALEDARVEKANASRIKKIEALKQAGKPIPHKLLQPIVAKSHPHEGQTAKMATGEAHAAGQAVAEAAGVHISAPGKVSLGQAVKTIKATDATTEKGAKGKKPTVASKGIAHVIAQEKVTPQYKLDKADKITPEQWAALSHDEKAIIRGELAKVQKDGFGPQQKKATELLDKLKQQDETKPKLGELTPGTPGTITTPSGKTYQKINLPKAEEKAGPGSLQQANVIKNITEAIHGPQTGTTVHDVAKKVDIMKNGGTQTIDKHPAFGGIVNALANAAQKQAYADKMTGIPGIDVFHKQIAEHIKEGKPGLPPIVETVSAHHESLKAGNVKEGIEKAAGEAPKPPEVATPNTAVATSTPKKGEKFVYSVVHNGETITRTSAADYTHASLVQKGHNGPVVVWGFHKSEANALGTPLTSMQKQGGFKVVGALPVTKEPLKKGKPSAPKVEEPKAPEAPKLGDLKPGAPGTITTPSGKTYQKVELKPSLNDTVAKVKEEIAKGASFGEAVEKVTGKKAVLPEAGKIENKVEKPAELPKHVQHAIDMANGKAPGASWSKNHLAAYQELTAEEFKNLPPDVQGKIGAELEKAQTKFLDPKKIQASKDLLNKFGVAKPAAPEAPKATLPDVKGMSPAQIESRAGELLGKDALHPDVNLTHAESKLAQAKVVEDLAPEVDKYSFETFANPAVAAKYKQMTQAAFQLEATTANKTKLNEHFSQHHVNAAMTGKDVAGNPLSSHDKAVISTHAQQVLSDHAYLNAAKEKQAKDLADAKAQFHEAAAKAEADLKPASPAVTLTDYDKATVHDAYADAWQKHATKAVLYGIKTYDQKSKMKADPQYASLVGDLTELKGLAGKLAVAHAIEHAASQNVPTDPDTGAKLAGPEKQAWSEAMKARADLEQQYSKLHQTAQQRLDHLRVSVGLKKRAIPKVDSAAVKAAAAESGFYKTSGYSGPNYGKHASAKGYMLAKVGPKLAVKHQSAAEKKVEKIAETAAKKPLAPKGEPVKLGSSDASISHLPDELKKQITADFKGMPKGKYLQDPAEDVFDNLVNLAAAHGKTAKGLSVDQVLKTIDETHSKNLGVANSGMLHKKVTDWLGTPAGKQYAETHSVPNAKVVKGLTGEIDLPKGVTIEPGEVVQKLAGPGPHDESLAAKDFHALTAAEAQAQQDAYMKANGVTWSAEQKKNIKAYTGNGHGSYETFNNCLRKKGPCSSATKQAVVNIQAAMMPLQQHALLKRGTGWPPGIAKYMANPKALVGQTFEDEGFMSTSVAGSGGHFSGKPLQLIIEAPKGTPAAFVNGTSHYEGQENEMLLAAGTKLKVLSVEKTTGGHTVMRVRVVGDM